MPTISLHGAYPRPYQQELQATPQTVVFNVPQDIPMSWCIDNIELDAVVPLMSVDGIVEEEILHLSPAENSKHQLSSQSLEFGTKIQFKYMTSTLTIVRVELCKVSLKKPLIVYQTQTTNRPIAETASDSRRAFCATFSSKVLGWTLTLIEGVMAFGLSFRANVLSDGRKCKKLEKIPSWRMDKHG